LTAPAASPEGLNGRVGFLGFESPTVQFEKYHANSNPDPLVAVHKRMF
jgi:hypothetical protein